MRDTVLLRTVYPPNSLAVALLIWIVLVYGIMLLKDTKSYGTNKSFSGALQLPSLSSFCCIFRTLYILVPKVGNFGYPFAVENAMLEC